VSVAVFGSRIGRKSRAHLESHLFFSGPVSECQVPSRWWVGGPAR